MISQEKLAELERLYAAATGGTWKYTIAKSGRHQISNGMVQVGQVWHTTANPASATATAICTLHNSFPELLATIRELQKESVKPIETEAERLEFEKLEAQFLREVRAIHYRKNLDVIPREI